MATAASVQNASKTAVDNCIVAFFALTYFFYYGTIGSARYPVATELVPSRLRAWTVGTATSLGYVLAWLTTFSSPYFINPKDLNWVGEVWVYLGGGESVCFGVLLLFYAADEGEEFGGVG